ncbi:hypothetical protein BKI52_36225 [marine bacterium AO1-C]|nr:hypothetical protein BKI52_36225 [marine bacterium AO1-C]
MRVAKSLVISLIEFALPASQTSAILKKYDLNAGTSAQTEDDWVEVQVYNQLWEELLQVTQNDWLGWECGTRFDILSTGLLGYIIRHSPDVRTALIKITQYSQLLSNLVTYEVQPGEAVIEVYFAPVESWQQQSPLVVQQETERIMSFMIQGLATLTGTPFHPVEIWLKRPESSSKQPTTTKFAIHFNAPQNGFAFTPKVLQQPLIHHNDQLLQVLEGHAQQVLIQLQPTTFAEQIHQKIVTYFQEHQHFCQVEWMADALNMSSRTLQRKLKAEDTAFTEVLEKVKIKFAKTYLQNEALSTAEVAFLLGYNEISAFYHFFKKHTQLTPRQFRLQIQKK